MKISKSFTQIIRYILGVELLIMMLVMLATVIGRYIFHFGIMWSDELTRYMLIWGVMMASAVLILDDSHIRVTLLEDCLPKWCKKIIYIFRNCIGIFFYVMILLSTPGALKNAASGVSPSMEIPMNLIYLCFPIMALLAMLFIIINMLNFTIDWANETKKVGVEAK